MSNLDVITLGCRLNAFESEVMRRHAADAGLSDAVIINTCAVTSEAVRQAAKTIRKVRRERPQSRIIVTGCAAQTEPERFARMPDVDYVIGNAEKTSAATFHGLSLDGAARVQVNDIMSVRETAPHMIDGLTTHTRGFVQIQNGCDHRCTFCIIPFGRGPSRSVAAGEVVEQISRLVDAGVVEIVLTGVDITSYGPDLPGAMTLGKLVRCVLKHAPDLKRLRLSSIDQVEIDADLLSVIADEPRFMPYLHLSMQSGDDMILKRMKRRHRRADAVAFCDEVRRLRPDILFGADLIAGFPTESDAMFENTLRIIDDCDLTFLHVFPFSPRQGTPAARMPQVAGQAIKARAGRLRAKGNAALAMYFSAQTGRIVDVLTERGGIGRTPQFAKVVLAQGVTVEPGRMRHVRLTHHDGSCLFGEVVA